MDIIEHNGHKFRVQMERDDDHGAPWEECDGHGIVSEWTTRAKAPGEMVLCSDRHGYKRYYDFAETVKIARRDGWDTAPYGGTSGQKAHRAAMADFERLRAWCNDQWGYVGVIVHLLDDEGDYMDESASLWGIESDCRDYLDEVARELADEIIERVGATLTV